MPNQAPLEQLVDQLATAKANCRWLLDNGDGLVDFKGLAYWGKRVDELRKQIKEEL